MANWSRTFQSQHLRLHLSMSDSPNKIETRISGAWRNRMILLVIFIFFWGLWFLYDGYHEWPARNDRYLAYQELVEAGQEDRWPEVTAQQGWPSDVPERFFRSDELLVQQIIGIVLSGLGLWALIHFVRGMRQTLWAADGVVHGPGGEQVSYESVRSIDMRKWNSKGIAVLVYEEDGEEKRLVVDDYKFTGAEEILAEIEERLDPGGAEPGPVDSRPEG